MFEVGTVLKRDRTGQMVTVDRVVTNKRGILYTVQYETGEYRRYYAPKLLEEFTEVDAKPLAQVDTTNVIFVDFQKRCKIVA